MLGRVGQTSAFRLRKYAIPAVDPGQSRAVETITLYAANVAKYEFARIENPNAPGAPAPIDSLYYVQL
jgi:hypothetical protein